MLTQCGRRQVVRPQLPKLVSAGSSPVARSIMTPRPRSFERGRMILVVMLTRRSSGEQTEHLRTGIKAFIDSSESSIELVILISGANHTGKTLLTQRLMERCRYPALGGAGGLEIGSLSGSDLDAAAKLFCDTVHEVNARDYTSEQLDAWAPRDGLHLAQIADKLAVQQTVGVKECGTLAGFGSLDDKGDIDMLFVHKDRQGQGIAKIILQELERLAAKRGKQAISTFASVTARPFFEHMGYAAERENVVDRYGISLANYLMSKPL